MEVSQKNLRYLVVIEDSTDGERFRRPVTIHWKSTLHGLPSALIHQIGQMFPERRHHQFTMVSVERLNDASTEPMDLPEVEVLPVASTIFTRHHV